MALVLSAYAPSEPKPATPSAASHRHKTPADHKSKLRMYQMKFAYSNEPRKRTRTSPEQLSVLVKAFNKNPTPDVVARRRLADATGMNSRAVQVWFQNRRAKNKSHSSTESVSSDEQESPSEFKPISVQQQQQEQQQQPFNCTRAPPPSYTEVLKNKASTYVKLESLPVAHTMDIEPKAPVYVKLESTISPVESWLQAVPPYNAMNNNSFQIGQQAPHHVLHANQIADGFNIKQEPDIMQPQLDFSLSPSSPSSDEESSQDSMDSSFDELDAQFLEAAMTSTNYSDFDDGFASDDAYDPFSVLN